MNIQLREISSLRIGGKQPGLEGRTGLLGMVDNATRRMAARRANILVEQEAERIWFWRLVKLEVERSRRRNTAFTVLCVRKLDSRTMSATADQLREELRDTDAVVTEQDRILVLLSETSGSEALQVTRRLADRADVLQPDAHWQEVAFPRDALTIGALIDCLHRTDMGERLRLVG